jgi:pimeloyl-ACP methyl ester carboxylesterase
MVLSMLLACRQDEEPPLSEQTPWTPPGSGVITLTTRDEVQLEADYYPQPSQDAPGIVLLHMVPPSNDRSNWPIPFRMALYDAGFSVLVVDRRGAGGSGGEATDAYEGPKGKNDVEACALRLADDGYGDLYLLGASNGTTSMLDYTVWAPGEALPVPLGLGFMTGGTYTENQNEVSELPEALPAVFTYSTEERAWSADQQALGRAAWVFHEYADGDHGTRMFEAAPEVESDLLAFFTGLQAGGT